MPSLSHTHIHAQTPTFISFCLCVCVCPCVGYVQGMSDLASVILYVIHDEVDAFWSFAGLMERMEETFRADQIGIHAQLRDLECLVHFMEPAFMEYLVAQDADKLYFAFRWVLVAFKREFTVEDVMPIWEVLWSDYMTPKYQLFVCLALLQRIKDAAMAKNCGTCVCLETVVRGHV